MIRAESNTIRNALSAVRRMLGEKYKDTREQARTYLGANYWNVTMHGNYTVLVKIVQHMYPARAWEEALPAQAPEEPPLEYSPGFGSREDYILATALWAHYWDHTPHVFKPCVQCMSCGKCNHCTHRASHSIHKESA